MEIIISMSRYCTIPKIFGFREWFENHFGDLCEIHDIQYIEKNITRKDSDLQFVRGMRNRGYPILAFFSYLVIRPVGWFYWNNYTLKR